MTDELGEKLEAIQVPFSMEVRTGGHKGCVPPLYTNLYVKCPFSDSRANIFTCKGAFLMHVLLPNS